MQQKLKQQQAAILENNIKKLNNQDHKLSKIYPQSIKDQNQPMIMMEPLGQLKILLQQEKIKKPLRFTKQLRLMQYFILKNQFIKQSWKMTKLKKNNCVFKSQNKPSLNFWIYSTLRIKKLQNNETYNIGGQRMTKKQFEALKIEGLNQQQLIQQNNQSFKRQILTLWNYRNLKIKQLLVNRTTNLMTQQQSYTNLKQQPETIKPISQTAQNKNQNSKINFVDKNLLNQLLS